MFRNRKPFPKVMPRHVDVVAAGLEGDLAVPGAGLDRLVGLQNGDGFLDLKRCTNLS
jgi:hypothetical protein